MRTIRNKEILVSWTRYTTMAYLSASTILPLPALTRNRPPLRFVCRYRRRRNGKPSPQTHITAGHACIVEAKNGGSDRCLSHAGRSSSTEATDAWR